MQRALGLQRIVECVIDLTAFRSRRATAKVERYEIRDIGPANL
jgi:hypothetical protein